MRSPKVSPLHQTLGRNIARLRNERKLTQLMLAEKSGIDGNHIGNIERGDNSPGLLIIERIAAALGVDVRNLLTPEEAAETALKPLVRLNELLPAVRLYQRLASGFGIDDVFQDNGGKLLQTLILMDLKNLPGREGNDAVDADGKEYELKTVNANLTQSFSTHHHLNPTILKKYRQVQWYFSLYRGIEVVEIWLVQPQDLEVYFTKWEAKWHHDGRKDINNPKIPLKFVRSIGQLRYHDPVDGHLPPASPLE